MTGVGVILGTPAYMSPEQARGHAIDKRTDIWAFGCVLFEMIAGRMAFSGATISDTLAAVLERLPDWTALPPATPPPLRHLLARCLEKDPKHRWKDIGDVRLGSTTRRRGDRRRTAHRRRRREPLNDWRGRCWSRSRPQSRQWRRRGSARRLHQKSDSPWDFPETLPLTSRSLRSRQMASRSSWRQASAGSSARLCGCDRWRRRRADC